MHLDVQWKLLEHRISYRGPELRPHWVLERTGIYGSALAGFFGPCDVATDKLVDWEDRLANDSIRAELMFHVVGEFFGISLDTGVLCQRLYMVWAETLLVRAGINVRRQGDDLYCLGVPGKAYDVEYKLSVSIATATPVSVLIHWGINVDAHGAPSTVKACGLKDFGWDETRILAFAKDLMAHYSEELREIRTAICKVRPVI